MNVQIETSSEVLFLYDVVKIICNYNNQQSEVLVAPNLDRVKLKLYDPNVASIEFFTSEGQHQICLPDQVRSC